jgi:thiamine biosynthesis lipoprotein ApbE
MPDRLCVFHYENVIGTSLELKIAAGSRWRAQQAADAALAEIERLAKILSGYDDESEFSRWFRTYGRPAQVSPELFEVLSLFDRWRDQTGGALDPSAEVVTRVWKLAAAQRRSPSQAELDAAVQSAQRPHWKLDASRCVATHLSKTPLVLNSLAKSYIVERASGVALACGGVRAVVVNIGGDLVVRGDLTERVHIADPRNDAENSPPLCVLLIHDRAVATSGNYRRGVEIDGRHYSHIVDPRTGRPVDHIISSTVVAPIAADAGALATAFCVLTIEESRRLAASLPGVEFLLVKKDGGKEASRGWSALEAPHFLLASMAVPAGSAPFILAAAARVTSAMWDPSFELVIKLELSQTPEIPYHQPYVAVWIEDENKSLVRTVALWYDQEHWLPELRAWYRAYRLRATAESLDLMASVSSATRPAGKYSLKWDGKDNNGRFVKSGKYIVCIEAVRQEGGYDVYRQEMDFSGMPKEIQLAGSVEIASASLNYRKIDIR